jgi:hypothetical protein
MTVTSDGGSKVSKVQVSSSGAGVQVQWCRGVQVQWCRGAGVGAQGCSEHPCLSHGPAAFPVLGAPGQGMESVLSCPLRSCHPVHAKKEQ